MLGREFELACFRNAAQPAGDSEPGCPGRKQAAIWQPLSELRYIFLHTLVGDTAYQMMTHQRRQVLHRLAARSIEQQFAADLTPHYGAGLPLRAGEHGRAGAATWDLPETRPHDPTRTRRPSTCFHAPLSLVEQPEQRLDLLLAREPVFDRIGQRERSTRITKQRPASLQPELANPQQQAEVALRQANLVRVQSRLTGAGLPG